ncbi:MAG: translocation/assembly module TamB [Bacteroidales bacterium]|jgi:hypothetical protein|nr:translocation/assembly module TamB [Bacteroidales bacterium]
MPEKTKLSKISKGTAKVIFSFAALLFILVGIVHSVWFTSYLGRQGSKIAEEYIGYPIYFDKIDFNFFTRTAIVTGFQVLDERDSNTLKAEKVTATLKSYNFKNLTIKDLTIVRPDWNIHVYKGDTSPAFEQILQKLTALKKDTSSSNPFLIENAKAIHGKFRYDNENYEPIGDHATDFKHIHLEDFNVTGRNIYIYKKQIDFFVDHTDFIERNGFKVNDFEGTAQINPREMHFTKLKIKTPTSKFGLDLHFYYKNYQEFKDFINRVKMQGTIAPDATLDLSDLAYFAYPLYGMDGITRVEGKVNGTVADMHCEGIKIKGGKNFNIETDVYLKGLVDYKNTTYNINIKNFSITKNDFKSITLPKKWQFTIPKELSGITDAGIQGTFNGMLNDFSANVTLNTNLGKVTATAQLSNEKIYAKTDIDNLQLDKILNTGKWLGAVTSSLNIVSNKTFDNNNINGKINSIVFNGVQINDIDVDINIDGKKISGDVNANDKNISFALNGLADFEDTVAQFFYNVDLHNADLQALKLIKDTSSFIVSSKIEGRNSGVDLDNLLCDISLQQTVLNGKSFDITLPRISLFTGKNRLTFTSDLLRININGEFTLSKIPDLYKYLKQVYFDEKQPLAILQTEQPQTKTIDSALFHEEIEMPVQNFTANIMIDQADQLADILLPELKWSKKLNISISCNTKENNYRVHADVPYIAYKKIGYIGGQVDLFTVDSMMFIRTTADKFFLDDSMYMSQFLFQTNFAGFNTINWGIYWLNNDANDRQIIDTNFSFGNIQGSFSYREKEKRWKVKMDHSGMRFYGRSWLFSPNSFIEGDTEKIIVNNFSLSNDYEFISSSGMLSKDPFSKLEINLKSVNISYLDVLYNRFGMDLDGYISGKVELWDVYNNVDIVSDISIEKFYINGDNYGTIGLKTKYDKPQSALLGQINIALPDISLLTMEGAFYPEKDNAFDFKGTVQHLPVNFLENYLSSFSSDISGNVSGTLRLQGTLKSPKFYTDVVSENFRMGIDVLNTTYVFDSCRVVVSPTEISFPTGTFHEEKYGGRGRISGKITHNNFKNIHPDLRLSVANTLVLNVPFLKTQAYSGTVFASGTCTIAGNASENIKITVNGRTEKNSNITFNTESAYENSRDFITFEDKNAQEEILPEYTYLFRKKPKDDDKTALFIELNIDGTPDILVNMGIKNSVIQGNLSARGKGQMRFISTPDVTQLFGVYTLQSGLFDLSMLNVIDKQFSLRDGSTISWTGPLKDAQLNLNAVYTTRTSLAPVLSSTEFRDNSNQKVNVESVLEMKGPLSNPNIGFDINLLTTNQEIKDVFSGYVNKENSDEIFKQTFSLLLFNSFLPVEMSDLGASTVASTAISSSSDILLGQFNNFISKISKNVDFGVNYRQGNELDNSEVQLMMGLQFFDNRLTVEGSMGIDVDNSAGNTSNPSGVVGDLNVEYKITDRISVKAFNRSDEKEITKSGVSYTQGVGVVYRRDFDSFKDLLIRKKEKKNKK